MKGLLLGMPSATCKLQMECAMNGLQVMLLPIYLVGSVKSCANVAASPERGVRSFVAVLGCSTGRTSLDLVLSDLLHDLVHQNDHSWIGCKLMAISARLLSS